MRRVLSSILATTVVSTALVVFPAVANAQCISDQYTSYTMTANKGLVLMGVGDPTVHRNYSTTTSATLTLSQSGSHTTAWSVNTEIGGTAGFDFWVIKAEVSTKVGGSYTSSKTTTGSVSVTITIPPSKYGIVQYGTQRRYTTGTYEHDNGYCVVTTKSIYTKLPYTANGSASTVNSTGVAPWDQAG